MSTGERSTRWLTSPAFGELAAGGALVVLVPVGSLEPHGPHLSLETDTEISLGAAERAAARLEERGLAVRIAPAVPVRRDRLRGGLSRARCRSRRRR